MRHETIFGFMLATLFLLIASPLLYHVFQPQITQTAHNVMATGLAVQQQVRDTIPAEFEIAILIATIIMVIIGIVFLVFIIKLLKRPHPKSTPLDEFVKKKKTQQKSPHGHAHDLKKFITEAHKSGYSGKQISAVLHEKGWEPKHVKSYVKTFTAPAKKKAEKKSPEPDIEFNEETLHINMSKKMLIQLIIQAHERGISKKAVHDMLLKKGVPKHILHPFLEYVYRTYNIKHHHHKESPVKHNTQLFAVEQELEKLKKGHPPTNQPTPIVITHNLKTERRF